MDLGNILKTAGTIALKNLIPGAGLIIDMVNGFLPDDKKLPITASGVEVKGAIDALPPEQRNALLMKEIDLEVVKEQEWTKIISTLAEADKTGASTRPWIAKLMAAAVFYAIIIFISFVAKAIWVRDFATIEKLSGSWELITVFLGIPSYVLRAYFGDRTEEKKARYSLASNGSVQQGNFLTDIISAIKR